MNDLKNQSNPNVRVFLVGNKSDLEEERAVNREEAEKFKEEKKLDIFMETSAKTGQNAKNIMLEAAKILYKDYLKAKQNLDDGRNLLMKKMKKWNYYIELQEMVLIVKIFCNAKKKTGRKWKKPTFIFFPDPS